MARLPEDGAVSYNGVDFLDLFEGLTSRVEAEPVEDASGRTVKYVRYTISVDGYVQSDSGTDDTLETLRQKLTQNGGELRYDARGYGTDSLIVNAAGGTIQDVAWGPKPKILSFQPLGGGNAAKVSWRCVTCIPECAGGTSATKYRDALLELVYKWSVSIDRAGYSRRTVSGHGQIAQSRTSATATRIRDTADRYWEKIIPSCPPGFYRESTSRDVDEGKNTLTFTVVDVEMGPQRYPPGVIDASFSHEVNSDLQRGFTMWQGTLSARYELEKGADKTKAWGHFHRQYQKRLRWMRANSAPGGGLSAKGAVLPTSLSVRELDAYGKEVSEFTLSYRQITTFATFLRASGLWLPLEDSDDQRWRASLANSTFHPRGLARLKLEPSDDVLINLCHVANPRRLGGLIQNFRSPMGRLEVNADQVTALTSWLLYEVGFDVEADDGTVEHKPLDGGQTIELRGDPGRGGAAAIRPTTPAILNGRGGRIENNQSSSGQFSSQEGYRPPWRTGTISVVQRTTPSIYVTLWGKALRAGYPINPPVLDRIGGVKAIPAEGGDGVRSWIAFNAGGIPVVACVWRLRYLLAEAPREPINPPVNPMMM